MASSFLELQKQARYRQWRDELAPWLDRPWTWPAAFALLTDLGVTDVYGFLAAGWWIPPAALADPREVDRLAEQVEAAMAAGRWPRPEDGYRWDDVARLEEICGIRPGDVVRRLVWNYALTPGEEAFARTLRTTVARLFGDEPQGGGGSA